MNCKRQTHEKHSTEISFKSANDMVPDSLFNFTAMLLNDKILELNDDGRVIVDQPTAEKAIIMSQHVLQHVSGVSTPLGIATTYHLFNQTRCKSLIMMNNRLGLGISYESTDGASYFRQFEMRGS